MQTNRFRVLSLLILACLAACNLSVPPAGDETTPAAQTAPPGSTTSTSLPAEPSPVLPTATDEPEAWFMYLEPGTIMLALVDSSRLVPLVSLDVGFTFDDKDTNKVHHLVLEADGLMVARIKYEFLRGMSMTTFTWTPWHGNGEYRLDLYKVNYYGTVLSHQQALVEVIGIPDDFPTVAERFTQAYKTYLDLDVPAPIFVHYSGEDPGESIHDQWVSAAYMNDMYYTVYFYDKGLVIGTNKMSLLTGEFSVCRPAGDYSILAVVVDYGNTTVKPQNVETKLLAAEKASNEHWSAVSAQLGLSTPILHTTTTVVHLDSPPNPGVLVTPAQVLALTGYDPADYDMLAEFDIDLALSVPRSFGGGGVAFRGACQPGGAQKVNMVVAADDPDHVTGMTASLYDHEMIHLFGWQHTWPDGDGGAVAQSNQGHWFPYRLFGWFDSDGDGVVEILDPDPYGTAP
jgi:hypothetical protein